MLKIANMRVQGGRLISNWNPSPSFDQFARLQMQHLVAGKNLTAILQIGEIADLEIPFYLYHDFSYQIVLKNMHHGLDTLSFSKVSRSEIERRSARQHRYYEKAAAIFTMSQWFADDLISSGISKNKIHVVYAGMNGRRTLLEPSRLEPARERKRLLFLGVDFYRKGGDILLKAFAKLRAELGPNITLTIAGPKIWPMPTEVPPGVNFLGQVPVTEVSNLYSSHDLFVMPSRFEGFGIVFVEALAHGLPVVARKACAMSEIVKPGINGTLILNDDPICLAEAICQTLGNDTIYINVKNNLVHVNEFYSWNRVADDMVNVINMQS